MITFFYSDKGPRKENQDAYCVEKIGMDFLIAVADGVGGNKGGETASRMAIDSLLREARCSTSLSECIEIAHNEIVEKANQNEELKGMATTLTAVMCSEKMITGVHCGDSRAYILRRKGLKQLSEDHTELAKLLRDGRISKEDAINYPRKHILESALGTHKNLAVQEFSFVPEDKDRLLIMTDGVHGIIGKRELVNLSRKEKSLENYCKSIINRIESVGAEDNYTIAALEFEVEG